MWFIRWFPALDRRCRTISPQEASIGAVPVQDAKRLRSANRATSPTSARIRAATPSPTPRRSINPRAGDFHHLLQLGGQGLDLLLDRDELGQLLDREPSADLARQVSRPHRGRIALAYKAVMSSFALPGVSSASSRCSRLTVWTPVRVSSSRRSARIRSASSCWS